MATLTYWVAECLDDSKAYSIRAKTKKEAEAKRNANPLAYDEPRKVSIYYKDAFDLMLVCLGEDRGGE